MDGERSHWEEPVQMGDDQLLIDRELAVAGQECEVIFANAGVSNHGETVMIPTVTTVLVGEGPAPLPPVPKDLSPKSPVHLRKVNRL